jgi:hypothetical protein
MERFQMRELRGFDTERKMNEDGEALELRRERLVSAPPSVFSAVDRHLQMTNFI